jgi:hypothetical protein
LVPPWEVAAQLRHSVGKEQAITERHAFDSPDYLSKAVEALGALTRLVAGGADYRPVRRKVSEAAVTQG